VRRARQNQRENEWGGAHRGVKEATTFWSKSGEDRRSSTMRCRGRATGGSHGSFLEVGWSGEAAWRAGAGGGGGPCRGTDPSMTDVGDMPCGNRGGGEGRPVGEKRSCGPCYTKKCYTVEDGLMECASEGNPTG
jgi:hypothetical protein